MYAPDLTIPRPQSPVLAIGSLVALALILQSLDDPWPYLRLGAIVIGWRLARPLTVIVHEFGHLLFGRLAGLQVPKVELGGGLGHRTVRLGATRLELSGLFVTGGSTHFVDPRPSQSRWRDALGTVGGPFSNGVAAALLLAAAVDMRAAIFARVLVAPLLAGAALSQISAMFASLWPAQHASGTISDGMRLLNHLKPARMAPENPAMDRGRALMDLCEFEAAAHVFKDAFEASPRDGRLLSLALHCMSRASGDTAALKFFLDHRAGFDGEAAGVQIGSDVNAAYLRANIAWVAIKAGGPELEPMAESLARAALATCPDAPEMKGTLGAVLVAQGDFEKGQPLLLDAARRIADPVDKADFCRFLAQCARRRGNEVRALSFEDLRRHILSRA